MTDPATPEQLPEIVSRSVPAPAELDPCTAYAKLRSYTPGRPSFLFESRAPDRPEGRYSIVGYRVKAGEMLPPAVDAISTQAEAVAAEPAASLAEAVARSQVGYFTYSNTHTLHTIKHWEDETCSGSFFLGATILLFDHAKGEITVAGPRAGRVTERCVWELEHADEIAPPPPVDPAARPATIRSQLSDERFAAKAMRIKPMLADTPDEVVLARYFTVPQAGADPFAAYRALRELRPAPYLYFVDFGQSPIMPPMQLLGASDEALFAQRRGDTPCTTQRLVEGLKEAFPPRQLTGTSPADAIRLIRKAEENTRDLFGGGVGYLGPGGESVFALADQLIMARFDSFEVPGWATLSAEVDPMGLAEASLETAGQRLAAIAAAQAATS